MIYLASPYSDPDPAVQQARFDAVVREAGAMMAEGQIVFSPIAHGHPIALAVGLPGDWEYWAATSRAMLSACESVLVLMLDGWYESKGVAAETELAAEMGLIVAFRDPR